VVENGAMVAAEDLADPAGTKAALRQQAHRYPAGFDKHGITSGRGQGGRGDAVRAGNTGDGVAGPGRRGQ